MRIIQILSLLFFNWTPHVYAAEQSFVFKSSEWSGDSEVVRLSIYGILGNPEKYEGLNVQLQGCLKLEFKHQCVYPTKESAKANRLFDGIWLNLDEIDVKEIKSKTDSMTYFEVTVEGKFTKKSEAPYNYSNGTINVSRIIIKPIN
jgi:hypothetical protein